MDVVGSGIIILDLNGLAGHHAEHMGMITAALLIKNDRILGNIEGAIADAVFHIDENIGEVAFIDDERFVLIGAFAGGVLRHVDLGRLRSRAIVLHRSAQRAYRGRINGRGSGGGSVGTRGGLFSVFFFVTSSQQQ